MYAVVEDLEEREEREEEEGDQNANLIECLTSCWRKAETQEKLGALKKELNIVRIANLYFFFNACFETLISFHAPPGNGTCSCSR